MTNFENLSELKSQLFDAPSDVKSAFNQVVQYFDDNGFFGDHRDKIFRNLLINMIKLGNYFTKYPDEYNKLLQEAIKRAWNENQWGELKGLLDPMMPLKSIDWNSIPSDKHKVIKDTINDENRKSFIKENVYNKYHKFLYTIQKYVPIRVITQ